MFLGLPLQADYVISYIVFHDHDLKVILNNFSVGSFLIQILLLLDLQWRFVNGKSEKLNDMIYFFSSTIELQLYLLGWLHPNGSQREWEALCALIALLLLNFLIEENAYVQPWSFFALLPTIVNFVFIYEFEITNFFCSYGWMEAN